MKRIKLVSIFTLLLVICFIGSCRTAAPIILTTEQQAIKIMNGDQATTLELMNTHTVITSEEVTSVYQARVKAVSLNADVAQLISYESNNGAVSSLTYRFWKKK